ncbi:hypothetical protein [Bacillus sp. AG4(2022)]|uniref:hypothetical protein n=1 Tax=Bacillus sp. AG4(2022) TaxID=2962594 RepID=UPI0028828E49|nr:hypothetical protein [Bacillus sp. AG4(2022)]MDT0160272.1 hypothetical protein [Bacillus sp. AG4(2022)]
MPNETEVLIKDKQGKIPVPQFKDKQSGLMKTHLGKEAPFYQLLDEAGNLVGKVNPLSVQGNVQIIGTKVEEQKTHTDAVSGTLTFSQPIQSIGIYNRDAANDGVFNVNGINLTIPKGESAEFNVGGTPSKTVGVTGSAAYIVTRYV